MARRRRQASPPAPTAQTAGKASVRTDKWLWAARCFKTRSQSTDACAAGHVKINDKPSKASSPIKVGDVVEVRVPGGRRILAVRALAERRGSAEVAATLFEDQTPPEVKEPTPQARWQDGGGQPTSRRDRKRIRRHKGW